MILATLSFLKFSWCQVAREHDASLLPERAMIVIKFAAHVSASRRRRTTGFYDTSRSIAALRESPLRSRVPSIYSFCTCSSLYPTINYTTWAPSADQVWLPVKCLRRGQYSKSMPLAAECGLCSSSIINVCDFQVLVTSRTIFIKVNTTVSGRDMPYSCGHGNQRKKVLNS